MFRRKGFFMFKFNFCLLILLSNLSDARASSIDPFNRVVCQASVQGVKVDLVKGSYLTAPPSSYLEGKYTKFDSQKRIKFVINIFIRETDKGILSAFFTLIDGVAGDRIYLGGSRFKTNQELDTWIGVPGTGNAQNPPELHLSCRKR
jgi:hypothetical protein